MNVSAGLQVPLVGDPSGHTPVGFAVWQWTLMGLAATCMGLFD
jgi:hypothetical protein